MRGLRRAVPLLAAGVLAACALPQRDNAQDPQLRPTARLSVSNGTFQPPDGCDATSVATAFSRGNCLKLDGSASSDFQDDIERWVFTMTSPTRTVMFTDSSAGGVVIVPPDRLRSLPPNQQWSVHLEVTDRAAHTSTADMPGFITIQNSKPEVVSPAPRVVPFFGKAWESLDANATLNVSLLGAESFDADDDPLCYCWTPIVVPSDQRLALTPNTETCQPYRDLNVPIQRSHVAETAVFQLRLVPHLDPAPSNCNEASDSNYDPNDPCCRKLCNYPENCSQKTLTTVKLGFHSPAWAMLSNSSSGGGQEAAQYDVERREFGSLPSNINMSPAIQFSTTGDPADSRLFFAQQSAVPNSGHSVVQWASVRDMVPMASNALTFDDEIVGMLIDDSTVPARLWAWGANSSGKLIVYVMRADTLGVLGSWTSTLSSGKEMPAYDRVAHRLWLAPSFGSSYSAFRLGSPERDFSVTSDRMVTGIALRRSGAQGAPELWVTASSNALLGGAIVAPEVVLVQGTSEIVGATVSFEAEEDGSPQVPVAMSFVDPDLTADPFIVWTNDVGLGLTAREIDEPLDSTPQNPHYVLHTLVRADAPFGFANTTDPRTGTVVVISEDYVTLVRASLDGSAQSELLTTPVATLLGPDPDGLFWELDSSADDPKTPLTLARGTGTGVGAIEGRFPIPLTINSPAVDYDSGDLLVAEIIPPAIVRLAPSGKPIDTIRSLLFVSGNTPPAVPTGTGTPLGPPSLIAADPNGNAIWAGLSNGLGDVGGSKTIYKIATHGARPDPSTAVALSDATIDLTATNRSVIGAAVDPRTRNFEGLTLDTTPGGTSYILAAEIWSSTSGTAAFAPASLGTIVIPNLNQSSKPRFARDLSDGGICVAWVDNGAGPFVQRFNNQLTAVGPRKDFGETNASVTALSAALGDCWIAFSGSAGGPGPNGAQVAVWRALAGTTILPESAFGSVTDTLAIYPLRTGLSQAAQPREAWIGGSGEIDRVAIVSSAGNPVLHRFGMLPVDFPTQLRSP